MPRKNVLIEMHKTLIRYCDGHDIRKELGIMNKFDIGETVFWIKYVDHFPVLMSFEIQVIKKTKTGYKYATESPGCAYIKEELLFSSIREAIDSGCDALEKLMHA